MPGGYPCLERGDTGCPGRSWGGGVEADLPPSATSIQAPSTSRASPTKELGRGHQGNSLPSPCLHTHSRRTNTNFSTPGPYPAPHLLSELRGFTDSSGQVPCPETAPLPSRDKSPTPGWDSGCPSPPITPAPADATTRGNPQTSNFLVYWHNQVLQGDVGKTHGKPKCLNPPPSWGPILLSNCSASAWMQKV